MINFFRKIRKKLADDNKPLKYMRYAIGEIVLVMIGILLALSVNNWNDQQKEKNLIKGYASSLILDLKADISELDIRLYQSRTIVDRIDSLVQYVKGKNIKELSNLDILCLSRATGYRPHQWNRSTIDILKSSGLLQNIVVDSLGKHIAEYNAFTYHLDEDFKGDASRGQNVTQIKSRIINYNYGNLNELQQDNRIYDNDLIGMKFFDTPSYNQAKSETLYLMTDDINELNEVINLLIIIKFKLLARIEIEFPRAISEAKHLIEILNEKILKP
jgi:hypothetical protein